MVSFAMFSLVVKKHPFCGHIGRFDVVTCAWLMLPVSLVCFKKNSTDDGFHGSPLAILISGAYFSASCFIATMKRIKRVNGNYQEFRIRIFSKAKNYCFNPKLLEISFCLSPFLPIIWYHIQLIIISGAKLFQELSLLPLERAGFGHRPHYADRLAYVKRKIVIFFFERGAKPLVKKGLIEGVLF